MTDRGRLEKTTAPPNSSLARVDVNRRMGHSLLMTNSKATNKSAARKAAALAKKLDRLTAEIIELRRLVNEELPPQNSEQECAPGALMNAIDKAISACHSLENASRYLADSRTEEQIQTEQSELRRQEARAETIRRYGCAA